MTARLDGQPSQPRHEPLKRPDCPWACVTWRDGGMMAEPKFFATREQAQAAAPADGAPYAVVNILTKPNARNGRAIPVIGEIIRRTAREETPYPDRSSLGRNYNPGQRHAPGLRPLTAPAATLRPQKPPPGMAGTPATTVTRRAKPAFTGTGTLTATARLGPRKMKRHIFARCVNGHRLAPDNWYRDCRGSICCLKCHRAREGRKREQARRSRRRSARERRVSDRRSGVSP